MRIMIIYKIINWKIAFFKAVLKDKICILDNNQTHMKNIEKQFLY